MYRLVIVCKKLEKQPPILTVVSLLKAVVDQIGEDKAMRHRAVDVEEDKNTIWKSACILFFRSPESWLEKTGRDGLASVLYSSKVFEIVVETFWLDHEELLFYCVKPF